MLFDLTKPLVWQFFQPNNKITKDVYLKEVYTPHSDSIRFFQSRLLEWFTFTSWWMVPIVWIPIVIYLYSKSKPKEPFRFFYFMLGFLLWTLLEYCFHRYLFHIDATWLPNKSWALCFHFLLHGHHHFAPNNPHRLTMPPWMFGLLATIVWHTLYYPFQSLRSIIAAGSITGYICYDLIHYMLHHSGSELPGFLIQHRKRHFYHHFTNPNLKFGVTTKLWDQMIGSCGKK